MKKKLKSILALTVASVALVGTLGITGHAYADNDFTGWPTLRQGNSGGYVRALQANLYAYGFQSTVGSIDGSFGSGTTSAVRSYQTKKGLTSDGVVGSGTWNNMNISVTTEVFNYRFYLWSGDSTTYWVQYQHPGGNTSSLQYSLMYKSNNQVINSGNVY
ncbi:peptidoglycan-binding domain-containing protein [Paenibacillus lautus]|uniref:peptidoglycan-binding domain-containing protein n=1 Tax=Paenibacillus lautus TaxID=1401 RepID=UPI003D2AB870